MTPEHLAKILDGHDIGELIPIEADVMARRYKLVIVTQYLNEDQPNIWPLLSIHLSGFIRNQYNIDQAQNIFYMSRSGLIELEECNGQIKYIPMVPLILKNTPKYAVTFDLLGKQYHPFDICKDEEPYSQGIVFNTNEIY